MKKYLLSGLLLCCVCQCSRLLASDSVISPSELQALINSAENGDYADQYNLAILYESGRARRTTGNVVSIPNNEMSPKKAEKYFLMSASQGCVPAMLKLGKLYAYGNSSVRNNEDAFRWFHTAAKAGDAEAQYQVGKCFASGTGVQKNEETAQEWFKVSASNGNLKAKLRAGQLEEALGTVWARITGAVSEATSDMKKGYDEEKSRQDLQLLSDLLKN